MIKEKKGRLKKIKRRIR